MDILPKPITQLIGQFERLPGIGPKLAARLTLYLYHRRSQELVTFAEAIALLQSGVSQCRVCFHFADDTGRCAVCSDETRDKTVLCIVEEPLDVVAIEKSRGFRGRYHVLGGAISPIDGIGPDQLTIDALLKRVAEDVQVREIILATNPSLEGEATASYLKQQFSLLSGRKLSVTRIARGIPTGGALEYADMVTLSRALEGRREY